MVHSDVKVGLKFFVKIISIKEITENYFLKFAVELVELSKCGICGGDGRKAATRQRPDGSTESYQETCSTCGGNLLTFILNPAFFLIRVIIYKVLVR